MVETRANRRKSLGLPARSGASHASPTKGGGGASKKDIGGGGDLHWSGAKKGGARGDSLLANLLSTGGVLALIATTPFIAIIV
jgi:hypothetical protein